MCGFLGIAGSAGRSLVPERLNDLVHRGPDAGEVWRGKRITLGHRRLAIIGLDDDGDQPMLSRSKKSVIVFNGEIYNYLDIADELAAEEVSVDRRFDTAVLIEALEHWGPSCIAKLNGMFAFAWHRVDSGRVLLARDRWGKKPLFWGRIQDPEGSGKILAFASEMNVLRRVCRGKLKIDPLGLARFFAYEGMPAERTIFSDVQKVPAAHWLDVAVDGRECARKRYWVFSPAFEGVHPEAAVDRATEALSRSFQLRLRSDVPLGLFLSGGIDSSTLACVWRSLRPTQEIQTFTIGFEDPSFDEREPAKKIARLIDSVHHELVLSEKDVINELDFLLARLSEPIGDPSVIPMSCLARMAREHVVVALGGDGGDELQAGYDPFRAWYPSRFLETVLSRRICHGLARAIELNLPVRSANMSLRFKFKHLAQGFSHPPDERIQAWMAGHPPKKVPWLLHPEIVGGLDPSEILEPTRVAFRRLSRKGELFAQINTWLETYLECCVLAKVDRAAMLHSLEVRAPLLDPEVAMALTNVAPKLIFSGGKGKLLLKRLSDSMLPKEILRRPKKGFGIPTARWLRTVLKDRFEDVLLALDDHRVLDTDYVARLWQAHKSGSDDHRRVLWSVLMLGSYICTE